MILIKNGHVKTMAGPDLIGGDVLIEDGKIKAVGMNLEAPADAQVIDAEGKLVVPGFVDAHCHIGLDNEGMGWEGMDYNEIVEPCTPHLRGIDSINPIDEAFMNAVKGGVTTAVTGPGSANVIGGTFAAIKLYGNRIDDMILKHPVAMKVAFGENPKRCYQSKSVSSRMTTAAILREYLSKARDYLAKKEAAGEDIFKKPAFDMKLEALIPVLKKAIPLKCHAHAVEDILAAVRIAKEFDVPLTLEHVTEGHLIVEELAALGVPLAVGPTMTSPGKFETRNRCWETPGILANAGCQVSIITDSPVVCQEYLPLCAGMAVKAGMDPFQALQAITLNAAKHAGIADRVGSLEAGKDADLVITDGSPFEVSTRILQVLIDGNPIK